MGSLSTDLGQGGWGEGSRARLERVWAGEGPGRVKVYLGGCEPSSSCLAFHSVLPAAINTSAHEC